MSFKSILTPFLVAGTLASAAYAGGGGEIATTECAGCHTLSDPGYQQLPVTERAERKGPPLHYAGNKFRREWLIRWLQEPTQIRPAGYYPPAHTTSGTEGDEVDVPSLPDHISLSASDAEAVTEFLMTLRANSALLENTAYEPGSISWRMGNLNFGKFNGCDACHRDAPDYGGISGPELYTAWERLQPKFIASFIAEPVAWDPHTLMPQKELNPSVVKKLVDYLKVNAEEEE